MLGSLIIFLKGRRRTMFQLSGFYYRVVGSQGLRFVGVGFMVLMGLWAGAGNALGWNGAVGGFRGRVWGCLLWRVSGFEA